MENNNRPQGRKRRIEGTGSGLYRRGEGLNTGPVGKGQSAAPKKVTQQFTENGGGGNYRGKRGGGGGIGIIVLLLVLLFGGGGGALSGLLGGGSSSSQSQEPIAYVTPAPKPSAAVQTPAQSSGLGAILQQGLSGSSVQSDWKEPANVQTVSSTVASGARDKFTTIRGKGRDVVTVMVYMCGTDLEAKGGMATKDLLEMTRATIGDNVNIIVYTGGCTRWNNNVISARTNQIYQVVSGNLKVLSSNAGNVSMTDPNTLASFISYCAKNFEANRYELIFWDHGGGSVSGYGYDEKNRRMGSMSLSGIGEALRDGGVTFDFIGFDTCLLATLENALMLDEFGDYMVASEETEPGVGWYYTNWVTALSKNTSISTLDLGKKIVDDFVDVCAQQCRGQQTTLSLVDLAELSQTMNTSFATFSTETKNMIANDGYKTVSAARSATREFAGSSSIDQIDLVHFAKNLNTKESKELADVLLNAIKYNRTGNITNAYGLSIYFPYKKVSGVDQAVATYNSIGLDSKYSECIREFASLGAYGQAAAGGTGSALPSLLGSLGGSGSSSGGQDLAQLLNLFMSGSGGRSVAGLTDENTAFLSERSMSMEDTAAYIEANRFDPANLVWTAHDGHQKIVLEQDQWDLVQGLDLNMFYDDGAGYVDLGLDNVFDFDEYGQLIGDTDGSWLSINGQPVAYYHLSTSEEDGDHYTITGRVPVLLNGEQMDLILIFTDEDPQGYIAGARPAYTEDETETVARGLAEVKPGDMLEFLCDYYSYEGVYQATYKLGSPMTVKEDMVISNTDLGGDYVALYRIMDIYGQYYWTLPVPQN